MDFFDAVAGRRSVRAFAPDGMPEAAIAACLEAARLAPSASNLQPWRFVVARDPDRRAALAAAGYGQPALETAPVIAVLLADRARGRERFRRQRELQDCGALDPATLATLKAGYAAREAARKAAGEAGPGRPAAAEDARLAAGAMLAGEHWALAATSLGYASCWIGLFDVAAAREACGWPDSCFAVALLPTGLPADGQAGLPPRPRRRLSEIAWRETAGQDW